MTKLGIVENCFAYLFFHPTFPCKDFRDSGCLSTHWLMDIFLLGKHSSRSLSENDHTPKIPKSWGTGELEARECFLRPRDYEIAFRKSRALLNKMEQALFNLAVLGKSQERSEETCRDDLDALSASVSLSGVFFS